MLLSFKNLYSLLCMSFSRILSRLVKRETEQCSKTKIKIICEENCYGFT